MGKRGRYVCTTPPLPKEPPPIADFTDEFNRYKKASLLIKNQVDDSSKKFDIINNNTVEALMYLTDNIEEIKFMRRDDIFTLFIISFLISSYMPTYRIKPVNKWK